MINKKLVGCLIILGITNSLVLGNVYAALVSEEKGNIFYKDEKQKVQLTNLGRDRSPLMHPKGEWVYFVRSFEGKFVGEKYYPPKGVEIKDGILKEELWRIKTDGTGGVMLFRSTRGSIDGPDPDYVIATVGNVQFSPSGNKIYFETPEWVTSAGLHVMSADGSDEKLLGGGNGTKIIVQAVDYDKDHNNYQGYIVTDQHRYGWFGGAYDWYWLFTPDFKEVGILGDDMAYFTEVGEIKYTDQSEKTMARTNKMMPSKEWKR